MRFVSKILCLLSFSYFLTGCAPIIIGGGVAAGGYTALRDKSIGNSINDTKIDTAIKSKLYKINKQLYSDISAVSDDGCVLLTGAVSNPEWISEAEKAAWSVEGVKVVDNNITAGNKIPVSQILKDSFITSSCRTSIMCAKDVRSVNYKLKTMNGIVYITGIALSEQELNIVLSKIQKINGVRKVVSYVNTPKK